MVITQRLTRELDKQVDLAGISWARKKRHFYWVQKAPTRKPTTALNRLETWAAREGVDPLYLTATHADNFIHTLKAGEIILATDKHRKGEQSASATTRRDIAAISAFYTFLERYHTTIKNPFRGTRIRPPNENKKEIVIPSVKEHKFIAATLPPIERAIVITLALRGLRAGALPTLEKRGERYLGNSKGKALQEGESPGITLPQKVIEAIAAAALDVKKPFAWITANAIERRINYHIGKLYQAGKISAAYSCHDFRHYFARNEYMKDHDILRMSQLLNHTNIGTTQKYLRSTGVSF